MRRYIHILVLIAAGEMVFGLAFNVGRFFRPTMLDVFGFTNTQLTDLGAIYGVTAMLSYFPGGAIADHFSARTLMSMSLFATALGGLYMMTIPGYAEMALLYGYWGITTIFLFWGALIRSTREWGGKSEQGVAFGLLEGGRGVVAAVVASLLVVVLTFFMPEDATLATDAERRTGFQAVVLGYTIVTFAIGVLVWVLIPAPGGEPSRRHNPFPNMGLVIRMPIVWAQAAIVVCAYCTYKASDHYTLYLVQFMGLDEVQAARLMSWGAYIRPVAAVAAGLIADRFDAAKSIAAFFAILALAYFSLSILLPDSAGHAVIYLNLGVSLFGAFALRGVYFALLQETRTPREITGAAVGMVSVVGFTPEIFFGPVSARILDATPGIGGFQNMFVFLAVVMAIGIAVVTWLMRLKRNNLAQSPVS